MFYVGSIATLNHEEMVRKKESLGVLEWNKMPLYVFDLQRHFVFYIHIYIQKFPILITVAYCTIPVFAILPLVFTICNNDSIQALIAVPKRFFQFTIIFILCFFMRPKAITRLMCFLFALESTLSLSSISAPRPYISIGCLTNPVVRLCPNL